MPETTESKKVNTLEDRHVNRSNWRVLGALFAIFTLAVGAAEAIDAGMLTVNGAIQESVKFLLELKAAIYLSTSFILFALLYVANGNEQRHQEKLTEMRKLNAQMSEFIKRLEGGEQ
jgi:hypothetical protein